MPYIAIRSYPKDEKIKQQVVEQVNEVFIRTLGCRPEGLSISWEEIKPEDWQEKVRKALIEPNTDKMMILDGKKS
jgi:phenylpyruvate tautomerase PptA (4-oxalocrotonate tautomerase family)